MKVFIIEPSDVRVGGVSLHERQERMLRQLGAAEITPLSRNTLLNQPSLALLLWGDTLLDPRIVQALLSQEGNLIAIDGRSPQDWVGAARLERDFFIESAKPRFGLESSESAIERLRSVCKPVDIAKLDEYVPKLRRSLPVYWVRIKNEKDMHRAEKLLMDSSEKDPSDLMAILHRPIENWVVVRLAQTPITPNQVTLLVNILSWIATYLFATGNLLLASLLTFLVSITDGFDGKLARLKGMVSKVGSLEHSFDLLFEFSWILALGYFLSQSEGTLPLLLAGSIITLVAFYRSVYDRYGQSAYKSLDVSGRFENLFRRIAGRRNLFNISILLCVLLQKPIWALYAILVHAAITALVYSVSAWGRLRKLDRQ